MAVAGKQASSMQPCKADLLAWGWGRMVFCFADCFQMLPSKIWVFLLLFCFFLKLKTENNL